MAKRGNNQLDDMQIRRWVADGRPIAKTDGGGLTFTLSKAGTAAWVLRYMRDGKAKELTIGNYPDITLAAARINAFAGAGNSVAPACNACAAWAASSSFICATMAREA